MTTFSIDVDLTDVDNNELLFSLIFNLYWFCWFIDTTDEFQRDFILEVHRKMSKKEYTLLDNLHISLKHELLSQRTINIFQKLNLLIILQRNLLHLRLFLPNITLHFVAKFTTQLIMFLQFMNS
jgi:hypothetical protein